MAAPEYTADNLPDHGWREYRKKVTTKAVRVQGPFTVATTEGPLTCQDGYLAVDARGFPYPIAADEFSLIYESVDADPDRTVPQVPTVPTPDPPSQPQPGVPTMHLLETDIRG